VDGIESEEELVDVSGDNEKKIVENTTKT